MELDAMGVGTVVTKLGTAGGADAGNVDGGVGSLSGSGSADSDERAQKQEATEAVLVALYSWDTAHKQSKDTESC